MAMLAQGAGSFCLWILYGILQARRSSQIRASVVRLNRGKRALFGAAMLVGGVVLLFGGFLFIQSIGGFAKDAMTWYGWILASLLGLIFVHLQTLGTAMLVSLGFESVTQARAPTSTSADTSQEPRK